MKSTAMWFVVAAVLLVSAATLAQVVPPAPGVNLPQVYFDRIKSDPSAFRFQKAWIEKARRASEARDKYLATSRPEGMTFSSLPQRLRQTMMVSGTAYVPVLMGKFSNTGADPYATSLFQSKLFSAPPAASMTSLYGEMSYGNLNLTGTVFGWYQVSNVDTYYEGPAGCYGLCVTAKTGQYIKEVLQLADPAVNFGTYDNDGPDGIPNSGDDDGFVDFVAIVQPEIGAECGGTNNIWSHRWVVTGWPEFGGSPWTTNDPRTGGGFIGILDYTIQPALGSANGCGTGISEIGVYSHEFGHAFGLPDLYDGSGGSGIGHWGLMGSGSWNSPTNPAHFDAWCKSQLGWIVPTEVGPVSQPYSIHSSEMNAEAYKLDIVEEKFSRTNADPIAGSWSMRCMSTSAEATARHWPGGAGYGNGWDEAVVREFAYNGSDPVNLQFDCAYDSETDYDFGLVKIDVNGTVTTLAAFDRERLGPREHRSHALSERERRHGLPAHIPVHGGLRILGRGRAVELGDERRVQVRRRLGNRRRGELFHRVRDVRGRLALRPDDEPRQGVLPRGEPEHERRPVRPGPSWPGTRHLPRRAGRRDDLARKYRRFGERRDPRDDARGSG